jgi:uncharacterized protein (TIGR01244 family)
VQLHRRVFATSVLSALLALSPAIGSAAPRASITASQIAIDNFGQIDDHYYRGAQPEGDDYAALAALGIKTVIDLQADGSSAEQGFVEAAGMRYHRIPMTTRVAPTDKEIAEFMRVVNDPASQPVYVHCAGGRHRTGVMTAVYRMSHDGWTADKAFDEMKHFKFGADFLHPEFKRFVYAYHVAPSSPVSPAFRAAVATEAAATAPVATAAAVTAAVATEAVATAAAN